MNYDERLAAAKANIRRRDKLRSKLRSARQLAKKSRDDQERLQQRLAKEQSDVDALEGLSITGLLHAMLGSKEDKLQKERSELAAAKLKFDQACESARDLGADVQRLGDELALVADADKEFEQVLADKEQYLAEGTNEVSEQLIELAEQVAELTADKKELEEVVQAGKAALQSMQEIQGTLKSAANWGTFDLIGGGTLTTLAKHSKIDAAKGQARTAQRRLIQFEEELADADQDLDSSLDIGGLATFADYFFDGLIADWIVQSKIQKAQSVCDRTTLKVQKALRLCTSRLEEVGSKLSSKEQQKRELIEDA